MGKENNKKNGKIRCGLLLMAGLVLFTGVPVVTAYAGPAEETGTAVFRVGPSGGLSADNSYYNQPVVNPVVKPVDRYSYDQMVHDLFNLAARYPGKMTLQAVGQSLDGRAIYNVIVGNPEAQTRILVQGAIHGREYIVTPLIMQQIESMLSGYDSGMYRGQKLSDLLSSASVHFVPMVNPDGVTLSQQGEAGIRSAELRQSIQTAYAMDLADGKTTLEYGEYLKRWKSNGRGVDLNYNFDADWETINSSLTHVSYATYRGPELLSEPESQTMFRLASAYPYAATVSYHAMGNVIYWDTRENKKTEESYALASAVASVTGYTVQANQGVGGFKDWHQRSELAAPGITIEVGRTACPVEFSEYQEIWQQNKEVPALVLAQTLSK